MVLNKWLNYKKWNSKTNFSVINVSENEIINDEIKSFLNNHVLDSYIWINYIIRNYKQEKKELLIDFLEKEILPSSKELYRVWQWDIWEIISKLIVTFFSDLDVPATKLKLKSNKDKSMFWTDMISHNKWKEILEWHYYEIKTKQDLLNKNYKIKWNPRYITIVAYDWLQNDLAKNCESIATFLSKLYDEKWDFEKADMYWNISNWKTIVNKIYEIFIIWEKNTYKDDILDALDSISLTLSPLNITIVLIDWFKELVNDLRLKICDEAVKIVYS